jgi:GxxExxY protein
MESAYDLALCEELRLRGVPFRCQIVLPAVYKGKDLGNHYRVDLLVNEEVVVEIKAVERVLAVHEAQLLTYMKLLSKSVGLLINFNVAMLTRGGARRVL